MIQSHIRVAIRTQLAIISINANSVEMPNTTVTVNVLSLESPCQRPICCWAAFVKGEYSWSYVRLKHALKFTDIAFVSIQDK